MIVSWGDMICANWYCSAPYGLLLRLDLSWLTDRAARFWYPQYPPFSSICQCYQAMIPLWLVLQWNLNSTLQWQSFLNGLIMSNKLRCTYGRPTMMSLQNCSWKRSSLLYRSPQTGAQQPSSWGNPMAELDLLLISFTSTSSWQGRSTPFLSTKNILRKILPESRCFIALDCCHGYFQMALSDEASYKTTFLLESGRYRYLLGPMGHCTTGDKWCLRSDVVIEGLLWPCKIVDDILIQYYPI